MVVKSFEANLVGKDYVVGDVHGQFSVLEKQLSSFFNPEVDRLFMVGDLVDRGPESKRVLEWLSKGYSVLGNHEDMILMASTGDPEHMGYSMMNGGSWFWGCSNDERDSIVSAFMDLPLAITVQRRDGSRVGIVHADIPYNSWDDTIAALNSSKHKEVREYMLWSRDRVSGYVEFQITDLHALYVGHTPIKDGTVLDGNVHYMDTGAWSRGMPLQIKEI